MKLPKVTNWFMFLTGVLVMCGAVEALVKGHYKQATLFTSFSIGNIVMSTLSE